MIKISKAIAQAYINQCNFISEIELTLIFYKKKLTKIDKRNKIGRKYCHVAIRELKSLYKDSQRGLSKMSDNPNVKPPYLIKPPHFNLELYLKERHTEYMFVHKSMLRKEDVKPGDYFILTEGAATDAAMQVMECWQDTMTVKTKTGCMTRLYAEFKKVGGEGYDKMPYAVNKAFYTSVAFEDHRTYEPITKAE